MRLRITLASIGDGVIATDADGRVAFMNPVAASLTGIAADDAHNRPLAEAMRIINEHTRRIRELPDGRSATLVAITG